MILRLCEYFHSTCAVVAISSEPLRENVMSKPVAISVGEISKAARATVEKALGGHKAAFPVIPPHRIGFVPPWWCGFVIYDAQVDKLGLAEAQKLATEVQTGIAGSVAAVKGGRPGVLLGDGNLTIGFAPPPDVNLFEQ